MNISWSSDAMDDLKAIYNYFKENTSTNSARKFRKKIFDRAGHLKSFPKLGKKSEADFVHQEIRYLIEGNYRIVYRLEEDLITIIAITDSRSNPDKYIY